MQDSTKVSVLNNGNVGIGTTSPSGKFQVDGGRSYFSADSDKFALYLRYNTSTGGVFVGSPSTDTFTVSRSGGQEHLRIDSNGDLLLAKTSSTSSTVGCELNAIGRAMFTRASGLSLVLNRTSSEGTLAEFRYDNNVTAGIAITNSGNILSINGLGSGLGFHKSASTNIVYPFKNNTTSDNVIDLGSSGVRFDDVYATNGTIQTSDQNEKNTITDSDLGIDFIKRLSPKSYIFNGKTRTHYGLIAQDVETVLTDIGKTGTDFAGFIKSDISEAEDGSEYRYGLRYTEFVAPLIKAVKDQQAIIEDLQARITALENA
jgi:hypothetical protein